jgi:pyridoxine 5-phosphate synthase
LSQVVKGQFNLEMAAVEEMVAIALELKPDLCTLVPEKRQELTTEGGLQVREQSERISKVIKQLNAGGIKVSLFIDPDPTQLRAAHLCGAQMVELHTGTYANARGREAEKELAGLMDAARMASKLELQVAAGHGLSLQNLPPLLEIEEIKDYSIGHAIVARAVFTGFETAVKEMLDLLNRPRALPRREGLPSPPAYRL